MKKAEANDTAQALRKAVTNLMMYRQHQTGCEIYQTDFCTCGLRETIDRLQAAWTAHWESLK